MWRRLLSIGLIPLPAVLLVAAGCAKKQPPQETTEVVVARPLLRDYVEYAVYTGRTEAVETQNVMARVSGPILRVNFVEGAFVHKGDVLYEIDPATYNADYASALAKVETANQNYISAKQTYDTDVATKGVTPPEKLAKDLAEMNAAYAAINSAQADADRLKLNVDYCTVRADIDGVISRTLVTPGNIIQAGGNGTGGTLLTTIVTVDPVYAYFDVDETTMLRVQALIDQKKFVTDEMRKLDPWYRGVSTVGLGLGSRLSPLAVASAVLDPERSFAVVPLRLRRTSDKDFVDDNGKALFPGYVDFVDNKVNEGTGTRRVRGLFANNPKPGTTNRPLTPGLFVRVQVPITPPKSVLMVADRAIVTDQAKKVLYVVDEQDKVVYRNVEPGGLQGDLRVIEKGLQPGDRVIIEGQQFVRAGMTVQPRLIDMPLHLESAPVVIHAKAGE